MTTLEFRASDALAATIASGAAMREAGRASETIPDPALWQAGDLDGAIGMLTMVLGRHSPAETAVIGPERLSPATVQSIAMRHDWQAEAQRLADLGTGGGPAIVPVAEGAAFFTVLRSHRGGLTLLAPDGARLKRRHAELDLAMAGDRPGLGRSTSSLQVPQYLRDRLDRAAHTAPLCYRLSRRAPQCIGGELLATGLPGLGLLLAGLLVVAQALEIAGWGLFGGAVLNGGRDIWGMVGWLLLLATLHLVTVPVQALQSELALRAGLVIKRRLQRGALALDLAVLRRMGPSALTSRTIEAQALEQSGLAALLMGLTAAVELATVALLCLGGAAGSLHLSWMLGLMAAIAASAVPYGRALSAWSTERREQASRLVESIAGHRSTRLQVHPLRRRDRIDHDLASYVRLSRLTDTRARWMLLGLPSLWTVGSVVTLIPAALSGGLTAAGVAITIGAALLGARAINTAVGSAAAAFRSRIAWLQLSDLLAAAPARTAARAPSDAAAEGHRLLDVSFRHPGRSAAVLDRITLALGAGDKVLLTGASGSGKSTLGAVLAGLKEPVSGRVVPGGGHTGRPKAMASPQVQENHIFSATVAENLFLARAGELEPSDEARALDMLQRLDLGALLERMPLGLFQRLGSGGWALSQGEKSRICLARALLSDADLLVLDESFGPLDPDTAGAAIEAARQVSRCLVVIAHP